MVKKKLPPRSGCGLEAVEPHPYKKGDISFFFFKVKKVSFHHFDVVCISKTYLDSTTALDDKNLAITGYNLLRADHASNSKRV